MNLDEKILKSLNKENLMKIYLDYKETKTDYLKMIEEDKRIMGEDGIAPEVYDKLIIKTELLDNLIKRIIKRQYLFKPFREIEIPKDKSLTKKKAIKLKKIRILSIANIKDVLIQKVVYESIKEYSEKKFKEIENLSYAYREGKSAPCAIRKVEEYVNDGYTQILNLDLCKFFDKIDHKILLKKIKKFYGEKNEILLYILKKFIKSYKIESSIINKIKKISKVKNIRNKKIRYMKKVKHVNEIFHHFKVKRTPRKEGIPQGGILSGLLANIYLYEFDLWIKNTLSTNMDIKYIRYADDFLILFKDKNQMNEAFYKVKDEMKKINLYIHEIGEKSKKINLNKECVEYLGFEIKLVKTKAKIRVKEKNLKAFKNRISDILMKLENNSYPAKFVLELIIKKINFKICGNRAKEGENCPRCGKMNSYRSWIGYFGNITDENQLKDLDRWIFKKISIFMYRKYKMKLNRKDIYFDKNVTFEENKTKLKSLIWEYYYYRRNLRKKREVCSCSPKEKKEYQYKEEEKIPFY